MTDNARDTRNSPVTEQARGRAERAALYAGELFLVLVWGVLSLSIGFFASWWGALGMFVSFVLGGVFRDFYNMRIGRL